MIRIGELAKTAKISKRTLYHYEQIGLLQPAHIAENGYRYYDSQAILRLQKILLLKSIGYTLEQIKELLQCTHPAHENDDWITSLNEQIELIEQKKEELSRKQYYLRSTIHAIRLKGTEQLQDLTHIISAMNERPLTEGVIAPEFRADSTFTAEETQILQRLPVFGSSNRRMEELVDMMGQAGGMMSSSPYSSEAQALAGRLYNKALELFEGDAGLLDKYWEQIRPADGA
ncbi:MerR family transcriptional regulator [Paenibacillus piscarius]|uniref:MerR family transcriptional regulator n=1 Tax=Paenibacillus piscarius TaxID=1089681 RepID=UPI001EE9AC40|nr:MerR family transcriptional regulator [Paenibacillus piscarius]